MVGRSMMGSAHVYDVSAVSSVIGMLQVHNWFSGTFGYHEGLLGFAGPSEVT